MSSWYDGYQRTVVIQFGDVNPQGLAQYARIGGSEDISVTPAVRW